MAEIPAAAVMGRKWERDSAPIPIPTVNGGHRQNKSNTKIYLNNGILLFCILHFIFYIINLTEVVKYPIRTKIAGFFYFGFE